MLNYVNDNCIKLTGYQPQPVVFNLTQWISTSKSHVATFERALGKPGTPQADQAIRYLRACGITSRAHFEQFKSNLDQLTQPSDQPKTIYCARCGRLLSDPVSKTLGYGPVCRRA